MPQTLRRTPHRDVLYPQRGITAEKNNNDDNSIMEKNVNIKIIEFQFQMNFFLIPCVFFNIDRIIYYITHI